MKEYAKKVINAIDRIDDRLKMINKNTDKIKLRLIFSEEYSQYIICDLYTGEMVRSIRSISYSLHCLLEECYDIIYSL